MRTYKVPPNSMQCRGRFNSILRKYYFREFNLKHPAGPFHIRTRDNVFATCNCVNGCSLNNVLSSDNLLVVYNVHLLTSLYIYIDIIDIKVNVNVVELAQCVCHAPATSGVIR